MYKQETDDLILVKSCIDAENGVMFRSSCIQKTHYKKAICQIAVANGSRKGTASDCFNDKMFMGPTVRNYWSI